MGLIGNNDMCMPLGVALEDIANGWIKRECVFRDCANFLFMMMTGLSTVSGFQELSSLESVLIGW